MQGAFAFDGGMTPAEEAAAKAEARRARKKVTDRRWREENLERTRETDRRWREENIERNLETGRRWREENREKRRETGRRWHEENRERSLERSRRWREANPERNLENGRRWHEENRERGRETSRRWREANPEKRREIARRRRSSLAGSPSDGIPYDYVGHACYFCGLPAETVEHIQPISLGGADTIENKLRSCHSCNASKGHHVYPGHKDWIEWKQRRRARAAAMTDPTTKETNQ